MRLVVIGGVAAGLSAASRARRIDPRLEIVVLERGRTISYAACGLPYYIDGRVRSLDELVVFTPERFAKERNIRVRTGAAVKTVAHARREVILESGEKVPYDSLVIATGARPVSSNIDGADLPHVFRLHTLDDAARLKSFLQTRRPRSAAIVGAGYVGLELADVLRANGLAVTIFQDDGRLLGRSDPNLKKRLVAHLKQMGVEFRSNEPVRRIEADRVHDTPAELVMLATGFRPNAELAEDAGAEIGRTGAIWVNEQLETSLHGVFAAGDCAEVVHKITGRPAYIPLGTTANKMGRIAGANAAGRRERFSGVFGTSIVKIGGVGVGFSGLSLEQAKSEGFDAVSASIDALERPKYFFGVRTMVELVGDRRNGRLLGGCVIGEEGVAGRINVIATALETRMKVEEMEWLDLAYAPPFARVWDPLMIAARQLNKALV